MKIPTIAVHILPSLARSMALLAAGLAGAQPCLARQAVPASAAARPAPAAQPAETTDSADAAATAAFPAECETIVLDLSGPRPTAQLAIGGGDPVLAIFDTGAAATVLRLEYAQRLGLPDQGEAAARSPTGTPMPGFVTTIEDARLGGAHFGPAMAVALDIPLPLPGIDAILSPAVFVGRLVRLDLRAGEARVLRKTPATIPVSEAVADSGVDSPMQVTRTPTIRIELPGVGGLGARLDTGSSNGLELPLTMAARLPLASPLEPGPTLRMVGARHTTQRGRVDGLVRVGPLVLHDPEVLFIDGAEDAAVGMELLRDVVIVLDPAEHRTWVLPAEAAQAR